MNECTVYGQIKRAMQPILGHNWEKGQPVHCVILLFNAFSSVSVSRDIAVSARETLDRFPIRKRSATQTPVPVA
jgi:hypothetical protein